MLIWENIKIACKALFSNKLRALLILDIIRQTRRQSWIPSKHYDMNKERR